MAQKVQEPGGDLRHLAEDTTGLGVVEARTARDLIVRPAQVLEAWMTGGASGHGVYARPLRFYLALNGVLMLILFLRGGGGQFLESLPPGLLEDLARQADKSREAFVNDADSWMSIVMVPVFCAFYPLVAAPLLRWWDAEALGWRRGFRATFAYLAAWTVPMVPMSWWAFEAGTAGLVTGIAIFVLSIVTFLRMGKRRWYRTWAGGVTRGVVLSVGLYLVSSLAMGPVLGIALAGALYGP